MRNVICSWRSRVLNLYRLLTEGLTEMKNPKELFGVEKQTQMSETEDLDGWAFEKECRTERPTLHFSRSQPRR